MSAVSGTSNLDLARQHLASLAENGEVSLAQALNTSIAGTKLSDLQDVKDALTGLAVGGKISVETVLTCVNSRYAVSGGDLVPKGTGTPLDAKDLSLDGLSDLAALMLLMIKQAAEQRKTGQAIRHAQSEAIQQKLFDSADDLRKGAIVALVFGVAAGVANIVAGAVSIGSMASALKSGGDLGIAAGKGQAIGGIGGGVGSVLGSIGQGVQGILGAASKEKDAEAEAMRNEREAEGDIIANLRDFMQSTMQLIQTLLDKENEAMTKVLA
jgi:hypothetical protein